MAEPFFAARARWFIERRVRDLDLFELAQRIAAATDSRVLGGPFARMQVDITALCIHAAPRLLGTYEAELHEVIEAAIAHRPDVIINVGCNDGYYAVGLALRVPDALVGARDIDPKAQRATARNAALNGVGERVRVGGRITAAELHEHLRSARRRALVVMDIDGGEAGLLDPRRAPALLGADIIVETHPTLVDGVDATLGSRFRHSHVVERIEPWPNDRASLAGLACPLPPPLDTDAAALRLAVAEHRDLPTPWLVMTAASAPCIPPPSTAEALH